MEHLETFVVQAVVARIGWWQVGSDRWGIVDSCLVSLAVAAVVDVAAAAAAVVVEPVVEPAVGPAVAVAAVGAEPVATAEAVLGSVRTAAAGAEASWQS